jgi:hypothetical protein
MSRRRLIFTGNDQETELMANCNMDMSISIRITNSSSLFKIVSLDCVDARRFAEEILYQCSILEDALNAIDNG